MILKLNEVEIAVAILAWLNQQNQPHLGQVSLKGCDGVVWAELPLTEDALNRAANVIHVSAETYRLSRPAMKSEDRS